MMTADKIKELIATVDGVSLVGEFSIDKAGSLTGRIAVATGVGSDGLVWEVIISPNIRLRLWAKSLSSSLIKVC